MYTIRKHNSILSCCQCRVNVLLLKTTYSSLSRTICLPKFQLNFLLLSSLLLLLFRRRLLSLQLESLTLLTSLRSPVCCFMMTLCSFYSCLFIFVLLVRSSINALFMRVCGAYMNLFPLNDFFALHIAHTARMVGNIENYRLFRWDRAHVCMHVCRRCTPSNKSRSHVHCILVDICPSHHVALPS